MLLHNLDPLITFLCNVALIKLLKNNLAYKCRGVNLPRHYDEMKHDRNGFWTQFFQKTVKDDLGSVATVDVY